MKLTIEGQTVTYEIEGDSAYGADTILFENDDNLIDALPWRNDGYTIAPFIDAETFSSLREGCRQIIEDLVRRSVEPGLQGLELVNYHKVVDTDEKHGRVIQESRKLSPINMALPISMFPIDASIVRRRVGELIDTPVRMAPPGVEEMFALRIIRPGKSDFNPLHRDAWVDRLRSGLNAYVPLAGSSKQSALPLIPGSHLWPESDVERTTAGATMKGIVYTVPAVINSKRPLTVVRPNPAANHIMLFSAYIIHGAGANFNADETRVSLELRFFRESG